MQKMPPKKKKKVIERPLGPVYHQTYRVERAKSAILNPRVAQNDIKLAGWRNESVNQLLGRIKNYEQVIIPSYEAKVQSVENDFIERNNQQTRQGRRAFTELPPDLQGHYDTFSAWMVIVKEELEEVKKVLKEKAKNIHKEDDGMVLKDGCIGASKLLHGVLLHVDGQKVAADDKGVLRINDKRSPYHGMACPDYFDFVVLPYAKKRDEMINEIQKKAQEAKAKGLPYFAGTPRPPLPPWPKEVKKIDV